MIAVKAPVAEASSATSNCSEFWNDLPLSSRMPLIASASSGGIAVEIEPPAAAVTMMAWTSVISRQSRSSGAPALSRCRW
jgi:hypothetical protein